MSELSGHLISAIKDAEGYRRSVYDDATSKPLIAGETVRGVPTIGYGLNLVDGIDEEEADWLLRRRLAGTERDMVNAFPWFGRLDPVRQDVIRELAYNMGVPRLNNFVRMIGAILVQDWTAAAKELEASAWWRQVQETRSARLAAMLLTGQYGSVAPA